MASDEGKPKFMSKDWWKKLYAENKSLFGGVVAVMVLAAVLLVVGFIYIVRWSLGASRKPVPAPPVLELVPVSVSSKASKKASSKKKVSSKKASSKKASSKKASPKVYKKSSGKKFAARKFKPFKY